MQYPFVLFSEYKVSTNPSYFKTNNGSEYCIFTISKSFKANDGYVKDTSTVQCFGDELASVRRIMERNNGIKGLSVDVYAERIPYIEKDKLTYSYRATKIAIASSYYYETFAKEKEKDNKDKTTALSQMETSPFNLGNCG